MGVRHGTCDPRLPGMGAPAVWGCLSPAGARTRKAWVERQATLARPGEGPGGEGARWSRRGPGRRGSCICTGVGWGHAGSPAWKPGSVGGGTGFPTKLASFESPPSAAANAFSPQPAKGGVWPARVRWRWPGRRNSFHFPAGCGERVPGARELGCQDAKPEGIRIALCNSFVGLSRETEGGEGLMESEADLVSEMLQRRHLQCFAEKY